MLIVRVFEGDIVEMAQAGTFDVLIHGCNCYHAMGSGVATQIRRAFPAAYEVDLATVKGDVKKLGTLSIARIQ